MPRMPIFTGFPGTFLSSNCQRWDILSSFITKGKQIHENSVKKSENGGNAMDK